LGKNRQNKSLLKIVSVELKENFTILPYIIEVTKWALAHFFLE
jgi:hypothetical protein